MYRHIIRKYDKIIPMKMLLKNLWIFEVGLHCPELEALCDFHDVTSGEMNSWNYSTISYLNNRKLVRKFMKWVRFVVNFEKQVTVILDLYGSLARIYYLLFVETENLNREIFQTIYFLHKSLNLHTNISINCILIRTVSRASAQIIV